MKIICSFFLRLLLDVLLIQLKKRIKSRQLAISQLIKGWSTGWLPVTASSEGATWTSASRSDYCLLAARDYGANQSRQHPNGGRYWQQWDGKVKGRRCCQPEQAGVRLHRQLPQHPLQSAAEGRSVVQEEEQFEGDTGGPQVSFPHSAFFPSTLFRLSRIWNKNRGVDMQ